MPTGSFFDYNANQPYNDQNKEFTVRFKCTGAEYFDDVLIWDFNKTVQNFNENMRDGNRENYMVQVPQNLLGLFNNRGYPRINPTNNKLEWWVSSNFFSARTNDLVTTGLMPSQEATEAELYTGD